MRQAREFWQTKASVRKSNPNLVGDERANGAPISGTSSSIVSDEIKRKQISIAVRYVAMARAR